MAQYVGYLFLIGLFRGFFERTSVLCPISLKPHAFTSDFCSVQTLIDESVKRVVTDHTRIQEESYGHCRVEKSVY